MRKPPESPVKTEIPALVSSAVEISSYLKKITVKDIKQIMSISDKLAVSTFDQINSWSTDKNLQRPAIDSFIGDIYSGLQVSELNQKDRLYANQHLRILSGLYGILRPHDGIFPYRLEMGYKLKLNDKNNLYEFWSDSIANTINKNETLINLSAVEYSKVITKYRDDDLVITPKFMTMDKTTKNPKFVVVHAKIARGAFANWMIKNRINDAQSITEFNELGYKYNDKLSSKQIPVFICDAFGGLGLSVRLS
jgi:cytoplasmic iron level regulating protein YaaA (DUF328/UPF0246 family)